MPLCSVLIMPSYARCKEIRVREVLRARNRARFFDLNCFGHFDLNVLVICGDAAALDGQPAALSRGRLRGCRRVLRGHAHSS